MSRILNQVIIVTDDGDIYIVKRNTAVFIEAEKLLGYPTDGAISLEDLEEQV